MLDPYGWNIVVNEEVLTQVESLTDAGIDFDVEFPPGKYEVNSYIIFHPNYGNLPHNETIVLQAAILRILSRPRLEEKHVAI